MNENNPCTELQLHALAAFLERHANVDFALADLDDTQTVNSFNWKSPAEKDDLFDCLRAHQRLVKIVPGLSKNTSLALLGKGIHSALQIAGLPKNRFLAENAAHFEAENFTVEHFYNQALAVRAEILLEYMAEKQASEPHASAVKSIFVTV